jgi:hypothetical protein
MLRGKHQQVPAAYDQDTTLAMTTLTGNGTSDLVCTLAGGMKGTVVASAVHASTGTYTVTLVPLVASVTSVQATVETTGAAYWIPMVKSVTASSTCTFTLLVFSGASAASPALADLGTTEKIHLNFALKSSDVSRVRA